MSDTASLIKETLEKVTKLEVAKKHNETLKASIESMKNELTELCSIEAKELDDVEKLEKLNISSLFHKVLGDKEQQLDKERQEYLAVNLKIKELKKSIELSQFELGLVEKKVKESDQLTEELNVLKQKREKEILTGENSVKNSLLNLHSKHDGLLLQKNEITEAHDTGREALSSVEAVLKNLQIAIQNAEWDMYSRGSYHDYHKHQALDRAAEESYNAQHKLTLFNKELLDVGIYEQSLHLNLNQISKFADTFFDNLISDWIIQNKIKNSFSTVESVRDKLHVILNTLESEFKRLNEEIDNTIAAMDDLVLKS